MAECTCVQVPSSISAKGRWWLRWQIGACFPFCRAGVSPAALWGQQLPLSAPCPASSSAAAELWLGGAISENADPGCATTTLLPSNTLPLAALEGGPGRHQCFILISPTQYRDNQFLSLFSCFTPQKVRRLTGLPDLSLRNFCTGISLNSGLSVLVLRSQVRVLVAGAAWPWGEVAETARRSLGTELKLLIGGLAAFELEIAQVNLLWVGLAVYIVIASPDT